MMKSKISAVLMYVGIVIVFPILFTSCMPKKIEPKTSVASILSSPTHTPILPTKSSFKWYTSTTPDIHIDKNL